MYVLNEASGPLRETTAYFDDSLFGQFLQTQADQLRGPGIFAGTAGSGGNRRGGLGLAIAEIDQRGNGVRDGARRAGIVDGAGQMHDRRVDIGKAGRLVLELGDNALGDLGADTRRARHRGLVAQRDRVRQFRRRQRAEHGQRDLGADALHGLQQAKPFALDVAAKAEQFYRVLSNVGFDRQYGSFARRGQMLQRARRAMHLVADAADVEDDEILAIGIDQALQLADHRLATFSRSAGLAR